MQSFGCFVIIWRQFEVLSERPGGDSLKEKWRAASNKNNWNIFVTGLCSRINGKIYIYIYICMYINDYLKTTFFRRMFIISFQAKFTGVVIHTRMIQTKIFVSLTLKMSLFLANLTFLSFSCWVVSIFIPLKKKQLILWLKTNETRHTWAIPNLLRILIKKNVTFIAYHSYEMQSRCVDVRLSVWLWFLH